MFNLCDESIHLLISLFPGWVQLIGLSPFQQLIQLPLR